MHSNQITQEISASEQRILALEELLEEAEGLPRSVSTPGGVSIQPRDADSIRAALSRERARLARLRRLQNDYGTFCGEV